MYLFYHPGISEKGTFQLSEEESRHALKVLRLKEEDGIHLTDGKGKHMRGTITLINKKEVHVLVTEIHQVNRPDPRLNIAISPIKSPSRWEWFVEKATELGVNKIIPLICHRTEKSNFKKERSMNIMISAMKQSHRFWLPEISDPVVFTDLLKSYKGNNYIAHCDGDFKREYISSAALTSNTTVLIGPEGDFTKDEIKLALENGYKGLSISKNRLRTETAGIVCCQSFNFANQL